MKSQDRKIYEMLVRVRDFGVLHATQFPPASSGGKAFGEMNTVVSELEHHATVQTANSGGSRVGTATRATLRETLRRTLRAFHVTARAIAVDNPGLDKQFRAAARGDLALLSAARGFLEDATPLKAQFIEHEMPADFLEDLKRHIDDFQEAVTVQNRSAQARINATASLDSMIERGLATMDRLEAIVTNKFREERPTLAIWESASHIERSIGRSGDQPKPDPAKPSASKASAGS